MFERHEQAAGLVGTELKALHEMIDRMSTAFESLIERLNLANETVDGIRHDVDLDQERADQIATALSASGDEIANVVESIQKIADRTDLLAVNAAIEAARAGPAGKGFSVVAEEIGRLAAMTTEATKKIGTQLTHTRSSMDAAADNISRIFNIVGQVRSIVAEVTERVVSEKKNLDHAQVTSTQVTDHAQDVLSETTSVSGALDRTKVLAASLAAASAKIQSELERLESANKS
jgi:methyl-accepting chemotaxis protein